MNAYHQEQIEAIAMVQKHLKSNPFVQRDLLALAADYLSILHKPNTGFKCVYLTESGCRWKVKPIVCEMFLCDTAKETVLAQNPQTKRQWDLIEEKRRQYTWPDQPVLFDKLEELFVEAGYRSPLMYLHNSPGLLRVKQKAGLIK